MVLFIILGVVVLITFVVLGVLFFLLSKEEKKKEEEKAIPVTDLDQLKKDLSSQGPISSTSRSSFQVPSEVKQSSLEDEKYKKRAQELEDELLAISKKADGQSTQARQMIKTLTEENESLKSQQANLEQAQQKLIESSNAKARLLEEEISRANATVSELNREKEALLSAPKADPDQALRHELESLKYELIKARAQSSGLERVSFNYKNQLEDFLKKVNAVQVNNDHLSQVKNRLEGMVQEIKLQNEELVKKDRLAQFELEKNRSRLVSLERAYEDFKARSQQQNQQ